MRRFVELVFVGRLGQAPAIRPTWNSALPNLVNLRLAPPFAAVAAERRSPLTANKNFIRARKLAGGLISASRVSRDSGEAWHHITIECHGHRFTGGFQSAMCIQKLSRVIVISRDA